MRRCVIVIAVLFFSTSGSSLAQNAQPPSEDELAATTARGRLLYEYDQAAWHSTDTVNPTGVPKGLIDRYVAQKTATGWKVMWGRFTPSGDKFLIVYEAIQGATLEVFTVKKHDPPLEDKRFYFQAARAIASARRDFHGEKRPYNVAVLPADKGNFYVYILPAQTVEGVYPIGGDVRYLISPDGLNIVSKRRMHQDIIDSRMPDSPTFFFHTHILSDTPEDSDVFDVLTRRPLIPEYISTCNFTYVVASDGSLHQTGPNACGKECEEYIAKLPSFQAFRKAGCPGMASSPQNLHSGLLPHL